MANIGFRSWFNNVAHSGIGNDSTPNNSQATQQTNQQVVQRTSQPPIQTENKTANKTASNNANNVSTMYADHRSALAEQERAEKNVDNALAQESDVAKLSSDYGRTLDAKSISDEQFVYDNPVVEQRNSLAPQQTTTSSSSTWDDFREYLANEKEERKKSRGRQMMAAIGDVARHLGQLAFSQGGYATPQKFDDSVSKVRAIDKEDADARRSDFMTAYQMKRAEEAEKRQDRQYERQLAKDIADLEYKRNQNNLDVAKFNFNVSKANNELGRQMKNDADKLALGYYKIKEAGRQRAADRENQRSISAANRENDINIANIRSGNSGGKSGGSGGYNIIAYKNGKKLVGKNLETTQVNNLYEELIDKGLLEKEDDANLSRKRELISQAISKNKGAWGYVVKAGYFKEDSSDRDSFLQGQTKIK